MKKDIVRQIINKTISDYSKIAADFDRTRSKYAWPILQEFASYVNPHTKDSCDRIQLGTKNFGVGVKSGDNVLDFGCGNGRLLDVLKVKNIVYKGIDPVKELIDIARQKHQDVMGSIEFKTIDFDVDNFKLDFPDKYFDKIFAIAVFHHIPSDKLRQDVLRELKRVLKDNGRIFLTVWNLWTSHCDSALHKSQKSRSARFSLREIFAVSKATAQISLVPKHRIPSIFADFLVHFHNVMSIWRGRALWNVLKFSLLKIFGRGKIDIDYGDLYIDYQTADNQIKVQRYHHAFTKRGIKKLAESVELKIEKLFYDENKYNLCAIIRK